MVLTNLSSALPSSHEDSIRPMGPGFGRERSPVIDLSRAGRLWTRISASWFLQLGEGRPDVLDIAIGRADNSEACDPFGLSLTTRKVNGSV